MRGPFGGPSSGGIAPKALGPKRKVLYFKYGQRTCRGECKRYLPFHLTTIDHIIPKSKGGGSVYENLQIMCQPCNNKKADHIAQS